MMTTRNGIEDLYDNGECKVSNFELKAVYDTNEKFFSELDRFRIMMINAPWQRKYGYPYVEVSQFTRRELQTIFSKKFRFEDYAVVYSKNLEREYKIGLFSLFRDRLQKVRMIELMDYSF